MLESINVSLLGFCLITLVRRVFLCYFFIVFQHFSSSIFFGFIYPLLLDQIKITFPMSFVLINVYQKDLPKFQMFETILILLLIFHRLSSSDWSCHRIENLLLSFRKQKFCILVFSGKTFYFYFVLNKNKTFLIYFHC